MRLKQKYVKEYGDKNSKIFKAKAAEIEAVLFNTLCKKLGCSAIVVTAINKGSLLVDFDAVFNANANVSAVQVQSATTAALKSQEMAVLSPDTASKPEAQGTFHISAKCLHAREGVLGLQTFGEVPRERVAEWLRRLTRKPKARTAEVQIPRWTVWSLSVTLAQVDQSHVRESGSYGGLMVKHRWPLLEICLSDFHRLAT